jgi:hypothetical protein
LRWKFYHFINSLWPTTIKNSSARKLIVHEKKGNYCQCVTRDYSVTRDYIMYNTSQLKSKQETKLFLHIIWSIFNTFRKTGTVSSHKKKSRIHAFFMGFQWFSYITVILLVVVGKIYSYSPVT